GDVDIVAVLGELSGPFEAELDGEGGDQRARGERQDAGEEPPREIQVEPESSADDDRARRHESEQSGQRGVHYNHGKIPNTAARPQARTIMGHGSVAPLP